jgi:hypothetical protein
MGDSTREPIVSALAAAIAVFVGLGGAPVALSQTEAVVAAPYEREVGPHRFPGAVGIPNPFLSTFVRSSTGIASTSGMDVGIYDFSDPPVLLVRKQVDLKYLVQEFEFQQRVGEDVAVRLALSGSGRLGTEPAALLAEGVSVIMGWTAGGTIRLAERPNFKLAGSLEASGNSLTVISVRSWIEDVIDDSDNPEGNSPVADESNLRMNAGLRAAWGKSRTTGFLLHGDVGFQEPYEEIEDTDVYWKTGAGLSLDMHEKWGPDLGFLLSAVYQSETNRNNDIGGGGWQTGLGIFYTGRPEFTAGLQTIYTNLKQTDSDNDFGAFGANLVLRYDFN